MSIQIRFAEANELYHARDIACNTWPAAYGKIISQQQIEYMLRLFYSDEALQNQYLAQQHKFILAFDNEAQLTGFASYANISNENMPTWKLHKLYVLPHIQKKGTGKALLQFIFNEMRLNDVSQLVLNVNRHNDAVSFYKKMGFSIQKTEDIDIGNGYFMNDYVMSILITTPTDGSV